MTKAKRVLIYSQDGLGLGHLRRTHNIAREILALEPETKILTIADSPAAPLFAPLPGLDYVKLPTIIKADAGTWQSEGGSQIEDALRLRAERIVEEFDAFQPDVLLIDHMPVGAMGELKPLLDKTMRSSRRPRLFLGLRDILDSPDVIRQTWNELEAYEYLKQYEAVLLYGCRELYDAESAYGLAPYAQRVIFCNYVVSTQEVPQPAPLPDEPFVLVMGGGGGDAFGLLEAFLEAMPLILSKISLRALLLTGPNMPAEQQASLVARAAPYPVQIDNGSEDAIPNILKASLVVTMAGYNSLCEVLEYRKKAIVVPRAGPSAEQRMRGRLFADRNLISLLEPENLSAEALSQQVVLLLLEDARPDVANLPPLDGARRAAQVLVGDGGC